jgi:hypothetical protein
LSLDGFYCVQNTERKTEDTTNNTASDEALPIETREEGEASIVVSATEEDAFANSPSNEGDVESKSECDVVIEKVPARKRPRMNKGSICLQPDLQVIGQLAESVKDSAQVMQKIAARRQQTELSKHEDDKDWIFAKLIYGSVKEIYQRESTRKT